MDFENGSTCFKLIIALTNDSHVCLQATAAFTTYLILYLLKNFLIIHVALMTSQMATAILLKESSVAPISISLSPKHEEYNSNDPTPDALKVTVYNCYL